MRDWVPLNTVECFKVVFGSGLLREISQNPTPLRNAKGARLFASGDWRLSTPLCEGTRLSQMCTPEEI